MEEYGLVYIWRDKKHNRYYIGCHWGTENDGYICSSSWMKNSYLRRPNDFRRRILERVYTNQKDMFLAEGRWLNLIDHDQLGNKYYNKINTVINHWTMSPEHYNSVVEKLKLARLGKGPTKTSFKLGERPSVQTEFKKGMIPHNKGLTLEQRYGDEAARKLREKYSLAKVGKQTNSPTKFKNGQTAWNKGKTFFWITDGTAEKRAYDNTLPDGWKKGRVQNRRNI